MVISVEKCLLGSPWPGYSGCFMEVEETTDKDLRTQNKEVKFLISAKFDCFSLESVFPYSFWNQLTSFMEASLLPAPSLSLENILEHSITVAVPEIIIG